MNRINPEKVGKLYTPKESNLYKVALAGFAVAIVVMVLILIILVVLLFLGGKEAPSEDLSLIQARLNRIEARIKTAGALENRIQQIEEKEKEVRQSLLKTDLSIRALKGDLNQIIEAFEASQKKKPPVPKKVEAPKAAVKASTPQTEKGYHLVSRGETLYRISKKYGISVDDLRRINNMDQNAPIHPGQKLLVIQKKE
jgi:LysM repeat protein